ncbi:YTH domain-containing protein ECT4 isoform X3 [Alnus glutinosa]|uniref:YTH domain-containing protein ECT4 isoform X3 n=1 Tax=Alnus glutinosa TaxID=3517 RepID=UPI002D7A2407|nr:YTH domain-containing protein ECT4 isoform X3 [Alnus glutinosa]
MAGEKKIEKPEPVATGLKPESVAELGEQEVASGKDGVPTDSTSSLSSLVDATSSSKGETDHGSVGEHGVYHPPTSCYNYYYPGYNGSFSQLDDHYNLHADGSHTGYVQQPVSYGSEAVPCYSWDATFVGDVPNGTTAGFVNTQCAPGSTTFAKSNGFNSMKVNGNAASKFSKSIPHTTPIRTLNKVPHLRSDVSKGLLKGYHPIGNLSSFTYQKQGLFSHNGQMNYRPNGREWNVNDRSKSRDRYNNKNGEFEAPTELTRGPRAHNKSTPSDSTGEKAELGFSICRDEYNLQDFQTDYEDAKFYIIKSYSEDDVHKSIKYNVWSSTPNGNKKLDAAFRDAEAKACEKISKYPIFLFFSVNGSGQFLGVAEMIGRVDFDKDMDFWQLDKWNGFFPVKWHIIKDVPNPQLRHIILENNDNRPVTFTRDTQEIGLKQGLEMLNIFKSYTAKTSLLDDFNFYENRVKSLNSKSSKPATPQMEMYSNGNISSNSGGIKRSSDPSSLINLTKNLSLNASPLKSSSVKNPPIANSIPSVSATSAF